MSDQQISLRELREWADAMKPVDRKDSRRAILLALVEAVEAAQENNAVNPHTNRLHRVIDRFKDYGADSEATT